MIFTTRVVQITLYTPVFFSDFFESSNLNFFQKKNSCSMVLEHYIDALDIPSILGVPA
jgi:hypothetical protein